MQAGQILLGLWLLCRTSEILLLFYSLPSNSIHVGKCKNPKVEKQQVQGPFKMLEPPALPVPHLAGRGLKTTPDAPRRGWQESLTLSGVGEWSWEQPVPTQRVVEDLGCCSMAHSVPGAVAVPDLVRNITAKYSGCRQSLWRKGNSCLRQCRVCFHLEAFARQTGIPCPLQWQPLLADKPLVWLRSCFQDWSFPVLAFQPKVCGINLRSGLSWQEENAFPSL